MTTIIGLADPPSVSPAAAVAGDPAAEQDDHKARDRVVAAKRVATIARNKEADRAERLAEIERQVSEGSLVIRQMTAAERTTGARQPVARQPVETSASSSE